MNHYVKASRPIISSSNKIQILRSINYVFVLFNIGLNYLFLNRLRFASLKLINLACCKSILYEKNNFNIYLIIDWNY